MMSATDTMWYDNDNVSHHIASPIQWYRATDLSALHYDKCSNFIILVRFCRALSFNLLYSLILVTDNRNLSRWNNAYVLELFSKFPVAATALLLFKLICWDEQKLWDQRSTFCDAWPYRSFHVNCETLHKNHMKRFKTSDDCLLMPLLARHYQSWENLVVGRVVGIRG